MNNVWRMDNGHSTCTTMVYDAGETNKGGMAKVQRILEWDTPGTMLDGVPPWCMVMVDVVGVGGPEPDGAGCFCPDLRITQ